MNKAVHITLGEPLGRFVDTEVESGRFHSPQEVIEAGLRLLEQEQVKLAKLREALAESEKGSPAKVYDRQALVASMRAAWQNRG